MRLLPTKMHGDYFVTVAVSLSDDPEVTNNEGGVRGRRPY